MSSPHSSPVRRLPAALVTALAASALAGAAEAQTVDLTVGNVQVNQVIPGVTLVGEKSAMVRAVVNVSGTLPAGTEVDGLLRVFVNGVEQPYSPVFSENGPIEPPTDGADPTDLDSSLNFTFIPPISDDVVLVASAATSTTNTAATAPSRTLLRRANTRT